MSGQAGPNVISDSLVMCIDAANKVSYPGSGTIIYDIGSSQLSGSLLNGAAFSNDNIGSISFDGSNDYIDMETFPAIDFSNGFTIESVAKFNSTAAWQRIIDFGNGAGPDAIIFGKFSNTLDIFFEARSSSDSQRIYRTTDSPIVVGETAYFAATVPAGIPDTPTPDVKIYKNGSVRSGSNFNGTNYPRIPRTVERVNAYIARSNFPDPYFNGNIYFIRIYNRFLSSDEILQNYNALRSRFGV